MPMTTDITPREIISHKAFDEYPIYSFHHCQWLWITGGRGHHICQEINPESFQLCVLFILMLWRGQWRFAHLRTCLWEGTHNNFRYPVQKTPHTNTWRKGKEEKTRTVPIWRFQKVTSGGVHGLQVHKIHTPHTQFLYKKSEKNR